METSQRTPNYLIELTDFLDKPIESLINEINKIEGIRLSDLKVRDLTYCNDKFIEPGQGVYVFKTNEQILLIGKVSSKTFTERIPEHFDIRPWAWFNTLLFTVCRKHFRFPELSEGPKFSDENYKKASEFVFENGKLVLINMRHNFERIKELESILRGTAETLNKFKSKRYNKADILSNILPPRL